MSPALLNPFLKETPKSHTINKSNLSDFSKHETEIENIDISSVTAQVDSKEATPIKVECINNNSKSEKFIKSNCRVGLVFMLFLIIIFLIVVDCVELDDHLIF